MPVEKLAQLIRSVYGGSSQMESELMKKMLDSTVSSKSDRDETELAELAPIEIDFTWETGLRAANILIFVHTGEYLSDLETVVLYGAWNNYTYRRMAEITGYEESYLTRDIGCSLWNNLSIALGVEVCKKNFKAALKREWHKYTQAILSPSRNQLVELLSTENMALFEGLLALGPTFYLERPPIEKNCHETICQPGSLIRIKGERWMGKTSLAKRILEQESLDGRRTVYLDFSNNIDRQIKNIDVLLRWLCLRISFQLNLENTIKHYYQKNVLNLNDKYTFYFEKYILNESESDIILAFDNIDYLFSHKKTAEKFLELLSDWHERSKVKGHWSKLKLILTQSTNASISPELDSSLSKMGKPIDLKKFNFNQVKTLASFYKLDWDDFTIYRLLKEMKGNPFLIRLEMYRTRIKNIAL